MPVPFRTTLIRTILGVGLAAFAVSLLLFRYVTSVQHPAPSVPPGGNGKQLVSEQTAFAEDEKIEHPVPLPPAVLKLILDDDFAREAFESADEAQRKDPSRLFRAAEVHLTGSDEVDMVVIGYAPMSWPTAAWFWVARSVRKDPQIVLFASGNAIALLESQTNGFRDIGTARASAAQASQTTYRFDGARYKESATTSLPQPDHDDRDDDDRDDGASDDEPKEATIRLPSPPAHIGS